MPFSGAHKWALKSKTILGIVLAFVVQMAPIVGINFGTDDAALITQAWDLTLTAAASILAIYGRFVADSDVTALPTISKNKTYFHPLIGVAAALLFLGALGACSPSMAGLTKEETARLHPEARFYQMMAEFSIFSDVAADYADQPFCDEVVVTACANPRVVVAMDEASQAAFAALEAARPLAMDGLSDDATLAALQRAQFALTAMITVVSARATVGA